MIAPHQKQGSKITFSHIVAAGLNGAIGYKGKLPWCIPEDMRFFHRTTKGRAVIMGRKTWLSMGGALPLRLNIVLTRQQGFPLPKGVLIFDQIEKAVHFCSTQLDFTKWGGEVFFIGGEAVYRDSLPIVSRIYLTRIHKSFKGDSFYVKIPQHFKCISNRPSKHQDMLLNFMLYKNQKMV